MPVRENLVVLTIFKEPRDRYHDREQDWVAKKRSEVEANWQKRFQDLPKEIQVGHEAEWLWPPWQFNAVVGYVSIGSDSGDNLLGEIFVRWRHLPRTLRWHNRNKLRGPDQIVYYYETHRHAVARGDNESYRVAVTRIAAEARRDLRKYGSGMKNAVVELPDPGLEFLDLAGAHRSLSARDRPDP